MWGPLSEYTLSSMEICCMFLQSSLGTLNLGLGPHVLFCLASEPLLNRKITCLGPHGSPHYFDNGPTFLFLSSKQSALLFINYTKSMLF